MLVKDDVGEKKLLHFLIYLKKKRNRKMAEEQNCLDENIKE